MSMVAPVQYREYQPAARDAAFREWESGNDSTLLVMATGTGKTTVAGMIAQQAREEHGWRTLFLAHREVLIRQAVEALSRFGLDVAVEMANEFARGEPAFYAPADVVVGTVQTMQGRRLAGWPQDAFGLIVIDEAHHSRAKSYSTILDHFSDYRLLGLTAMPERGDKRNLGAVYRTVCFDYGLRKAITDGWLVPLEFRRCKVAVDLRKIKTTGGDFNLGDLEERIGPKVEELADAVKKEVGDRPGVAFTPDCGSAQALADALTACGVPSRYVAGEGGRFGMPRTESRQHLLDYKARKYQIVVCCDLLMEGWDAPLTAAVVIARPTKMAHRFAQCVGRGTRPSEAKENCLVIDFDWQVDKSSRDLCRPIDLFDDSSADREALDIAGDLLKAEAESDPVRALVQAERIIQSRSRLMVRSKGRRAEYEVERYDPIGLADVLGIQLQKRWDFGAYGGGLATQKQIGFLRHLGVREPGNISKWGASKLIDKLTRRQGLGLAAPDQVRRLLEAGVSEDFSRAITAEQAERALAEIESHRAPQVQQTLFG